MKKGLFIQIILIYFIITAIAISPKIIHAIGIEFKAKEISPINIAISAKEINQGFLTSQTFKKKEEVIIAGKPIKIIIPSINIELEVVEGGFNGETWDLADDKSFFANNTVYPNTKEGNTLIYGHNTNQVFYFTANLQVGDKVYVYADNNAIFEYEYSSDEIVSPDNTNVFNYTGEPRLTLLTCNGWFSENRRLMYFKFIKTI